MQNLGDGTSQRRGPGREILGQSSALACRQNGTVTAKGMQRLAKQHTSKLQLAASAVRTWRQYARGGTAPLGVTISEMGGWSSVTGVVAYHTRKQAAGPQLVYGIGMYAVRCYMRLPAFLSQGPPEHDDAHTSATGNDPVGGHGQGTCRDLCVAKGPAPHLRAGNTAGLGIM